ncbi:MULTISPECIES: trimeric intracellular cation channel family protein [unclassified Oceanispirochaeta]|uniref:trimeric intracellular cation channel family protein n=1 Tax=unclassified Oceanispirochaeta TaxID=2635722 RepID=UPI000E093F16|nr:MULTISPECIES: trimeric intracellular cation channel family protein [unclassified Oceanispirochaeta]MBF9017199.1 trimeric intracellular cation channel family protein [Oceanispirochaeta sp. M2]NPD73648.1 trimeric intracellular cation channel family protein [Oceanispirochaeta sp. M1]RDG30578.1 trimeric intracellular cation channel family protein [Oceanispirochaeta sp. M1]
MGQYIFAQAAVAIFAITGVLGAIRKDRDILGLVVLGLITAIGGGTIRDTILDVPVFWIADSTYIIVAAAASALTFFLLKISTINDARYRILLYFDALGVAYFCIQAFEKTISLGHSFPLALMMSFITGMGGGVMRDVLTGRPNLLITTELYATPALLGSILYGILRMVDVDIQLAGIISVSFIFIFRSLAVFYRLHMPRWLVNNRDS